MDALRRWSSNQGLKTILCVIICCLTWEFLTKQQPSISYNPPKQQHALIYQHDVIQPTARSPIQVIYKDLSDCPARPQYLTGYKAHCWIDCVEDRSNKEASSCSNVSDAFCMANLQLVGIRKSATTDFSKWLQHRKDIASTLMDHYLKPQSCPVEHFKQFKMELKDVKNGFYASGPGSLVMNKKVTKNTTHLTIVTAMQYLGYMSTSDTKFYVILRNPTDRAISYLFHWHKEKIIYKDVSHKDMTSEFIDSVVREWLDKLQKCIDLYGAVYCAYVSDGYDGDMNALLPHSMYVVYIREAFKFIPREQFLFGSTEEYSKNMVAMVKELEEKFFGIPFQNVNLLVRNRVSNSGNKNPVWPSTLKLLDDFYKPYNEQLAELLGDMKWLFLSTRT